MTLSVSTETVLDSETRLRILPAQRLLEARNDTGPAFQAPVWVRVHIASFIERIHLRWADEEAILGLALLSADFLVYLDMSFLIDLEHVSSEFLFHLQRSGLLYLEQVKGVFQG